MTTQLATDILTETLFDVLEQTTPRYTAVIVDETGTPLGSSTLATLLLSLYVIKSDGTITYLRNDQNALNANNVTVDASGNLVWSIQIADTTLVENPPFERHIALWQWTWIAGGTTHAGKKEVVLVVKNLVVAT